MMARSIVTALLFLFIFAAPAHAQKLPDTIVHSPEVLYKTRQRVQDRDHFIMPAYKQLLREADRALKEPAETVIFKPASPPGGRKHDYWSVAPDYWPDPKSRTGLPYVRRDGERNPEADAANYDRERLRKTADNALTLALAWYLSGNEEYAGKGGALIWSWCCDSVTRMNPNMRFAQMRPSLTSGTWEPSHYGLIEGRELIKIVEAARILEPSHAWSRAVTKKLDKWFEDYVDWMLKSKQGRRESGEPDNHGTWYDAQLAVFALHIGKVSLAQSVVAEAAPRRLIMQVERNGSMPFELRRTRSRHYTFFNLEAFFTLAAVGERVSVDLWQWEDVSGVSIKKALDFATPYLAGNEPWPFGDVGKYDPFDFTPLFHRAAMVYKEERYRNILTALPGDKLLTDRAQLVY